MAVRRLVPMGSAGGLDDSGASGRENGADSRNGQKVECVERMGGVTRVLRAHMAAEQVYVDR